VLLLITERHLADVYHDAFSKKNWIVFHGVRYIYTLKRPTCPGVELPSIAWVMFLIFQIFTSGVPQITEKTAARKDDIPSPPKSFLSSKVVDNVVWGVKLPAPLAVFL